MRTSKFRAVGLAAALLGWSFAAPRVRWRPIPNASLGTALVAVTRSPLGLRPPALWSGMRYGLTAGTAAALGIAAITALPPVRRAMAQRDLPQHAGRWLLVSIPIGTVWPGRPPTARRWAQSPKRHSDPPAGGCCKPRRSDCGTSWMRASPDNRRGHRAGHRHCGLVLRLAARAVGQPRRADAGALGGQRGRRRRGAGGAAHRVWAW